MLDTNTISELVRHPDGHVARKVRDNEHLGLCTSIIVSSELRFGVAKNNSERLRLQVDAILSGLDVLPFEHPADYHYGRIRAELHSIGKIIGPNDILIAAHACARGTILVTNNLKEFSRVPGLKAETWL
ncbi:putative nucleic acid-binding protein, contains PIN domain containing protein [Phyllobacterium sp. YR531]|nr:putative nucleic acid-binding protein, contains PIN domain containing protein [Phyllobacterium sp. YR531]